MCVEVHHLKPEGKKEAERENKRQICAEPSVTPELSEPQHVLHTVYRWGQRPNGTASKAALGSHTNTGAHQNKLKYTSRVHTAVCRSPGERGNRKSSQPVDAAEHSDKT